MILIEIVLNDVQSTLVIVKVLLEMMIPLISSIALLSAVACSTADSIATARSIKNKRICRSCGEVAKEVSKRLEQTALNPRVIQVAARIGADGRPILGRKIDYLSS